MNKEVWRQFIHASGVFIVILGMFIKPEILILLCIGLVVFAEALFRVDKYHHVPLLSTVLRTCKRDDDEKGFIYFFLGILITIYIFKFNMAIANAAVLILLFGDSVSTLAGRKFGRHTLPLQDQKTFEGSLAFLAVGFLLAVTQVPPAAALIGAFFGMLTEAYSPIDDNIPVPIVSATAITIFMYWL